MVDGREYREIPENLMIGIELTERDHEITLRYRQPMVMPGIVISAISLLLWFKKIITYIRNDKKQGKLDKMLVTE